MKNDVALRRLWSRLPQFTVSILLIVLTTFPVFSQGTNASLSGTVTDAGGGLIPGVTVTATNTNTGVVTSVITARSSCKILSPGPAAPLVKTLSMHRDGGTWTSP